MHRPTGCECEGSALSNSNVHRHHRGAVARRFPAFDGGLHHLHSDHLGGLLYSLRCYRITWKSDVGDRLQDLRYGSSLGLLHGLLLLPSSEHANAFQRDVQHGA